MAIEIQLGFPIEEHWRILETFMIESLDHGRPDDDLATNGMSLSRVSFGLCVRGIFGYHFRLPFCHNRPPRYNPNRVEEIDTFTEWEVVPESHFDFEDDGLQYLWDQ